MVVKSATEVRDRMTETLTSIMEQENHKHVLAVSSGGACFRFLWGIQDPSEELKKGFGNCTIFVFEYENKAFKLSNVIRPEF